MNSGSNNAQHSALLATMRNHSRQRILCHDITTLLHALRLVVCTPRACHCTPNALSHALCLTVTSLQLSQCPFPVATQMNFVVTWDLLTMTELCRDLKFSCRDLVSTPYTSLCRDKEKSCHDIKFLATSALCRYIEELCRDKRFSFLPVLCPSLSR